MALIQCPDCNANISDLASACPHCGYPISSQTKPAPENPREPEVRRTKLGSEENHVVVGVVLILFGVLSLILTVVFFLFLIAGIIEIFIGISFLSPKQSGICPYCHTGISFSPSQSVVQCPNCKNRSVKRNGYLETIVK